MEVVSNNYMPGDPRLVQQLVYELKSQGIFDQFRKECISDVDTKPAYQNLRQRVEGSVTTFLKQQTWRPDMNKNQVREQLRKSIYESGYLETGVERIVDQVVNPKINTVFLPHVEDVVYRYLGIEKPNRMEIKKELKIDVTDLLPTDLEAVSPESDHTKEDSLNLNDSNVDSKLEEDESPPFEPLDVQSTDVQPIDVQPNDVQQHEDNSVDSHLSGFSGLQSHDSNPCNDIKICQMELSNQDSQVSQNSSESHLSIVTSEENTKMEICEESESKLVKSIISEEKIDISIEIQTNYDKAPFQKDTEEFKKAEKVEPERKEEKTFDEKKCEDRKMIVKQNDDKKPDEKRTEDRKYNERKNDDKKDDKKSRSSEKHSSRDRKDDKYKKGSNHSSSKDKDKSSSRHSSSASSKDKDKSKERKESKTSTSNSKNKVEKDKDKPEKDRSEKEKSKSEKDRDRGDKEKSKTSSSSSSSKHSSSKDKDKSYSSSRKESLGKDKDKSRSSSSSTSKEGKSKSSHVDSKSKSSADKHKKDEKTSHNGKHSSSSSSLKKDKDKKRDSKKESKDDHYSSKEKKNDRRSTDRDSNDGQSSRQSQSNSFTESSSNIQKNSQESSNSNSGSGSGDSGNSDQIEHKKVITPIKPSNAIENIEVASPCADIQKLKYIKPKFASNFEEARKLMKIRKQLAKLERQNQLSLTQIEVSVEIPTVNGLLVTYPEENISKEVKKVEDSNKEPHTPEMKETISSPKDVTPMLQSTELSKENWEALEARLAQEMSNINYNSYESPYDYDYDYARYNSVVISPRKNIVTDEKCAVKEERSDVTLESSKPCKLDFEKREEVISKNSEDLLVKSSKRQIQEVLLKKDPKNDVEKSRKLRVELESSIYTSSKGVVKIIERGEITNNGGKHKVEVIGGEKIVEGSEVCNKIQNKMNCDQDAIYKNDEEWENVSDIDYECRYLEIPSHSLEKNLQFIKRHIKKLEWEVEHSLKAFQNNFLPLKRTGCKRKLEENVDFKNNNKAHYEQTTTETKKRRRSIAPNPHSVISQANREKMCNSTDISPNDSFSLPLSPAESDKSNDKKEDESPKLTKQKRNVIGRNTSTRTQRYSSDDLYKPRPIIIASTRRSRGAKNPGN